MGGPVITVITDEQQACIDAIRLEYPNSDLYIAFAGPNVDDTDDGEPGTIHVIENSADRGLTVIRIRPDGRGTFGMFKLVRLA